MAALVGGRKHLPSIRMVSGKHVFNLACSATKGTFIQGMCLNSCIMSTPEMSSSRKSFGVGQVLRTARHALCAVAVMVIGMCMPGKVSQATESKAGTFDRGDNALWMRRHWLHENPTKEEIAALVESLRAHGIRRIYPFLGPMDRDGWPGWRSKTGLVRYVPERAGAFLAEIHRVAPEISVIPWTGGILDSDVRLRDEKQRRAFAEHARQLIALGADGVHLNVEPVPSWTGGYLEFLREVKAAIGEHTLSVAAYPPPTPLQPAGEVHWELPFMREVCRNANELAIMAYDTGITSAPVFEGLISRWTRELAATLSPPSAGGCEWLMGIPAYDDDKDYHRPEVETIEHSLKGLLSGLRSTKGAEHFRGVAIYASFTTGEQKWAVFDRLWRGVEPAKVPPPDPGNTTE